MKQRGLRDTPSGAKRIYALSGIMKCALCGTNYTGDRGIYRCNASTKPGDKCPNNDISQRKVERAVFGVINTQILNINNIRAVVNRVKKMFQANETEIPSLAKRLAQIENEIRRVMKLYRVGTIDEDLVHIELVSLQKQKKAIQENLDNLKAAHGAVDVSDVEIRTAVGNFKDEVMHADPKIRKRAIRALFKEIWIHPKKGAPWKRILELKGVCVPLTRLSVASPTGFEPVLPA
ncbi:MAG: zinc ribbon domain-containing protein [Deltaproteobacteria bacterium]|nr:zinc ribbon domain-containing protein [Deltaproteobacteria bacterium]